MVRLGSALHDSSDAAAIRSASDVKTSSPNDGKRITAHVRAASFLLGDGSSRRRSAQKYSANQEQKEHESLLCVCTSCLQLEHSFALS